jgi:hypothetical protein
MSTTTFDTHQKTDTKNVEHTMPGWLKWALALGVAAVLAASITLIATNVGTDTSVGSGSGVGSVAVTDAQPATYQDLRLAAEWAKYMEAIRPELFTGAGHAATWADLMMAAAYAER